MKEIPLTSRNCRANFKAAQNLEDACSNDWSHPLTIGSRIIILAKMGKYFLFSPSRSSPMDFFIGREDCKYLKTGPGA
jgi:hypothetical protein